MEHRLRDLAGVAAVAAVAAAATTAGGTHATAQTARPSPTSLRRGGATHPRTTTIVLTVQGCDSCSIEPVQNQHGTLTYTGSEKTVHARKVRFVVPTARTRKMAFLVYAPFDELAQGGIPMVPITAFRAKEPGQTVEAGFDRGVRNASGCWAGTSAASVSDTLVVSRFRRRDPLVGPGLHTTAAGYLRTTLRSIPYWSDVTDGDLHASDPSICR